MHDLLPPEAAARQWLGSRVTAEFEAWGYELVTTPPFEHAEVLERGLDALDRRDLLRFVEPESGEVALLRPDITPQIARIVATRLAHRPPPWRLSYSGSVVRQRRGRARTQRQIAQAGVELIGETSERADAEVISLAARALGAAGLSDFTIELHLVGLARAALGRLPEAARALAESALTRKDAEELARVLRECAAPTDSARTLLGAVNLFGDVRVIDEARDVFGAECEAALGSLSRIVGFLLERGLAPRLTVDLGDVRGASYYTGVSFTLLAPGPGEPLGSGGRYDRLLGRFGLDVPATGVGIDLSNLEWALAEAGGPLRLPRPLRVVVRGGSRSRLEAVADALRSGGIVAAILDDRSAVDALDYAQAWGYDAVACCEDGSEKLIRVSDRTTRELSPGDIETLGAWARTDGRSDE
jgi:ATP phosphoribosyltransferase regulatory subunit